MRREFPKTFKGYADVRKEISFGERFYLDKGQLSRHLRIGRSGQLYRIAGSDGFFPSERSAKSPGENAFSRFIRQVWEGQPKRQALAAIGKNVDHQVPGPLLSAAKIYSEDFGIRFTWEKKHLEFQNSLGVRKSKWEKTNMVRIDRIFPKNKKNMHLRRFLYDPTVSELSKCLSEIRGIEKSFGDVRLVGSSSNVNVILDPAAASVWLHEVVGHWGENVTTKERFEALLGRPVAPDFVSVYDTPKQSDSTFKFAFDEEGIASKNVRLIENGRFREPYLSLERAYFLDEPNVNGHARAQDFKFSPTPRMMNICLSPGKLSYKQMMRDMHEGYLVCGSLGGLRGNAFSQVQCQYGFKVEQGKLAYPVFGPLIVNLNSVALESIVAVSKEFEFKEEGGCLAEGQFLDQSGRGSPYIWLKNTQIH